MNAHVSLDEAPGCAGCPDLIARGESTVQYGSLSESTPFLEFSGSDTEPVLRFYCTHGPSVAAAKAADAPIRRIFRVDTIDGIDHATGSWDVTQLAEHPGAVSDVEVPRPVRPPWCLRED